MSENSNWCHPCLWLLPSCAPYSSPTLRALILAGPICEKQTHQRRRLTCSKQEKASILHQTALSAIPAIPTSNQLIPSEPNKNVAESEISKEILRYGTPIRCLEKFFVISYITNMLCTPTRWAKTKVTHTWCLLKVYTYVGRDLKEV